MDDTDTEAALQRDPERLRGHRFPFSFHPLARHRSRICWSVISLFFFRKRFILSQPA